jgi:hypothetical protein
MEHQGGTPSFQPGSGQRSGDIYTLRVVMGQLESPLRVENGLIEPSPDAHASDGLYIARTLGPRQLGGTGEGPECYTLRPETNKRIPPSTLWASHAADLIWWQTTTCPRHYPEVTGRDCSGQAKPEWRWIPRVRPSHRVRGHFC